MAPARGKAVGDPVFSSGRDIAGPRTLPLLLLFLQAEGSGAAVAAFCELGGVIPVTPVGCSDELNVSAQLRGASHPQRDAWLADLSHILL